MSEIDTSTEAVEEYLSNAWKVPDHARALLRSLAAERDFARKQVTDARYEIARQYQRAEAARRAAFEEAAKVAEHFSVEGKITPEGFIPGPNYKSAIAFAIRSLAEKEPLT